jgi:hypothetical protein
MTTENRWQLGFRLRKNCSEGEKDDSPTEWKKTLCHGPIATPIAPRVNAENGTRRVLFWQGLVQFLSQVFQLARKRGLNFFH